MKTQLEFVDITYKKKENILFQHKPMKPQRRIIGI
jgi:hypothetical protein